MSDSRAPYLPPQRPYLSRRVFVMRGKKAFYLRVSEWGGLDSNQRPTDYESYGARVALSIWCRLVPSSPDQEGLPGPFVSACAVLCVPVR